MPQDLTGFLFFERRRDRFRGYILGYRGHPLDDQAGKIVTLRRRSGESYDCRIQFGNDPGRGHVAAGADHLH